MRPKKTFRALNENGRVFFKRAATNGENSPEDVDLDADLANTLALWREKYRRFFDPAHNPSTGDVKATLAALAALSDSEIDEAVRLLDWRSLSFLKEAARLDYRREQPDGLIPADALNIRGIARQSVRDLAAAAIKIVPAHKGNPTKISGLDHLFAVDLVTKWNAEHLDDPAWVAIRDGDPSEFQNWAWEMFARVGRRSNRAGGACLSETSLTRILGGAVLDVSGRT